MYTEISCKYRGYKFQAVAQRADFEFDHTWIDAAKLSSVHGVIAV